MKSSILIFFVWALPLHSSILFDESFNIKPSSSNPSYSQRWDSSPLYAFGVDEVQGVLARPDSLLVQYGNAWDMFHPLISIPKTSVKVNSHFIYVAVSSSELIENTRGYVVAEIEFDGPILGVVGDPHLIYYANPYLNPGSKAWGDAMFLGTLESSSVGDETSVDLVFLLSPTRIRILFTNLSSPDVLRVITLHPDSLEDFDDAFYPLALDGLKLEPPLDSFSLEETE